MMEHLEHGHTQEEIEQRLKNAHSQSYLRDWIYGGIDGAVTTFAVVSGVVGGQLAAKVILILGFANLIADGFSMAASNYLGTKAELEQYKHYKAIEEKHIAVTPEGEKNEIVQIFKNKGLQGEVLDKIVNEITADKALWVKTMLQEEYGLPLAKRSPLKAAFYTFSAFIIFGLIPLLPYVFNMRYAFWGSWLGTGLTFFTIGSIKSYWSTKSWLSSGIETLLIGAVTAGLAYLIGWLLGVYVK